MKRILIENGRTEITPEKAMTWYCWHQIVSAMEKERETLNKVTKIMNEPQNSNIANWEYKFLIMFLETANNDLILG